MAPGDMGPATAQAATNGEAETVLEVRDLKKFFTVFEAVIIAILGLLVCLAALSLLMPIMQIRVGT